MSRAGAGGPLVAVADEAARASPGARREAPSGASGGTLLVLSYVFPPAAYVGGHRTAKYCKYLPLYGWNPIVVTIDPKHVEIRDEALLRDLPPNLTVLRTPDPDPAKWIERLSRLRNRFRRPPRHEPLESSARSRPSEASSRQGPISRLRAAVERVLLRSPDSHLPWVPLAFLWGAWILTTRRVDVIYSSSPPHSCHLATWLLAKCFRKPYVIDFRDPWRVSSPDVPGRRRRGGIQPRLKRAVISGAAKIVAVSQGEREGLRAEFPEIEANRFVTITNGYDEDDFRQLAPAPRDPSRFVLTHAGTIYSRAADELFEALELLLRARPELQGVLRVDLVGASYIADARKPVRLIRNGTVVEHGVQPHAVALRRAAASDVLLLLLGGDDFPSSHLPAKTFEYLRLGRPILAVTREGDLSRLLAACGIGVTVPPKNPALLAETIGSLHDAIRTGRPTLEPRWEVIAAFERRLLTARLADALDEACRTPRLARQATPEPACPTSPQS